MKSKCRFVAEENKTIVILILMQIIMYDAKTV